MLNIKSVVCLSRSKSDPGSGITLSPPAVKFQNVGIPTVDRADLSEDSLPVFVSIPRIWLTRGRGIVPRGRQDEDAWTLLASDSVVNV